MESEYLDEQSDAYSNAVGSIVASSWNCTDTHSLARAILTLQSSDAVTHLDLSSCSPDHASVEPLLSALYMTLPRLPVLRSLNLSNTCIFNIAPHPLNSHPIESLIQFCDALTKSSISELDVSSTRIVGTSCREHKGFMYLCTHFLARQCTIFTCMQNKLHATALSCVSQSLHLPSLRLIELNLSYNALANDNNGKHCDTGVMDMANALQVNTTITRLCLAYNSFTDEDIARLATAMHKMLQLNHLDLAGNECSSLGCAVLGLLLVHHASLPSPFGVRHLSIAHNPVRTSISHIGKGLQVSETLTSLDLTACGLTDSAVVAIGDVLQLNATLLVLSFADNDVSQPYANQWNAEVFANNMLVRLQIDPLGESTSDLTPLVRTRCMYLSTHFVDCILE